MRARHAIRAFAGILRREALRLLRHRSRLISTLVRPLLWLAVFSAGFRAALGLSITPPYATYILYQVYIVPGLAGMMLLFHGLQSSLAMVHDRESGSMRMLLASPLPRPLLLALRMGASVLSVLPLVMLFLLLARFWDVRPPLLGYLAVIPALVLGGLALAAAGLLISAFIRQIEDFAAVMNFVIFPALFASSALYPLWRLEEENATLAWIAWANPFTHVVELIRFSLYLRFAPEEALTVLAVLGLSFAGAVRAYDPGRGFWGTSVAAGS